MSPSRVAGAGGNPTAVAVVSDLLQAAQYGVDAVRQAVSRTTIPHVLTSDLELPQYVRFVVRDRPGIIAAVAGAFPIPHQS